MMQVDQETISLLFGAARSQNGWLDTPVSEDELREAYAIARWGPTSMNIQPMRVLFLRSSEAKERLVPALSPTNVAKVMTAPIVSILAYDMEFADLLPKVFPHNPGAKSIFTNSPGLIEPTAFRNGTLQAAYLMLAFRAVGLDVGPMSGFDPTKVNSEFFPNSSWRANFLCGIGHGEPKKVFERLPRLSFDEIAKTL